MKIAAWPLYCWALLQLMQPVHAQPLLVPSCQNSLPMQKELNAEERWQRFSQGLSSAEVANSPLKQVIQADYAAEALLDTGFDRLGMTISAAKTAVMQLNGVRTKVLVFAGGLAPAGYEAGTVPLGNALFVVNAASGELIWRATHANAAAAPRQVVDKTLVLASMQHSFAASPAALDIQGDGLLERIYIADVQGQLFRFDVNQGRSGAQLLSGQLFAQLGGAGQQFFTTPDVALINDRGRSPYLSLALGTGGLSAPLGQSLNNSFYVLRDFYIDKQLPENFSPLNETDLVDVTELGPLGAVQGNPAAPAMLSPEQRQAIQSGPGYFLRLQPGEAVLSNSLSFRGQLLFSTLSLTSEAGSGCVKLLEPGRTLALSLRNSTGVLFAQQAGQFERVSSQPRQQLGIPPTPMVLIEPAELGQSASLDCADDLCVAAVGSVKASYWREEEASP